MFDARTCFCLFGLRPNIHSRPLCGRSLSLHRSTNVSMMECSWRNRRGLKHPQVMGNAEKEDGAGGPIILFFIVGLVASLLIGWVAFPSLLYSQKKQPIDFDHALHVELVGPRVPELPLLPGGRHLLRRAPGWPSASECHMEANSDHPEEVRFVEEYVKPGTRGALAGLLAPAGLRLLLPRRPREEGRHGLRDLPRPDRRVHELSRSTSRTGSRATAGTSGGRTSPGSSATPGTA